MRRSDSISHRLIVKARKAMLFALCTFPLVPGTASAGPIGPPFGGGILLSGTPLQFSWEVAWDPVTSFYHYTYALTNNGPDALEDVRVTIGEDRFDHKGLHDEFDIFGPFARDESVPGISDHNYDWSPLDVLPGEGIPPAASVFFGFHDVHGPGFEPWRVQVDGQVFLNDDDDCGFLAPVPRIGGTGAEISTDGRCGELVFDDALAPFIPGVGGAGIPGFLGSTEKAVQLDGSAVTIDGDAVEYLYFLRNTGTEPIGPEVIGELENHFDFFVNENTEHFEEHGHDFNFGMPPENLSAIMFGNDSTGHDGMPVPTGIDEGHNFFWHALGDGAVWLPGNVLTLGFVDIGGHGPVASQSGFSLIGFNENVNGLFSPPVLVPGPFTLAEISDNLRRSTISEPSVLLLMVLAFVGYIGVHQRSARVRRLKL